MPEKIEENKKYSRTEIIQAVKCVYLLLFVAFLLSKTY
jgi:hypothetical protein